ISYVVDKGLLKGVSEGSFAPNEDMTRAMFATVLHRLAGELAVSGENGFKDVKAGSWYENAVLWATEKGIVNGVGTGVFAPNRSITREQIAVMLYNYVKAMDLELPQNESEAGFNDQAKISAWATEAMQFMQKAGIIQGDNKNNCNPKAQATRAEVATMLHRFMEMIEG
ncbi:MAG: S-layer homology domain-containing protein, partial [Candidatus Cellulosilyticum pullistercoris]|nr:S-layer homology domain-containing protein [Candidatus Cellulosilyticum pullistercoris]